MPGGKNLPNGVVVACPEATRRSATSAVLVSPSLKSLKEIFSACQAFGARGLAIGIAPLCLPSGPDAPPIPVEPRTQPMLPA